MQSRLAPPLLPGALTSSVLDGPSEGTLDMSGSPPDWLAGHLIRAGAGVFDLGGWSASHWADGLGMLVRFDLRAGTPIRWRQAMINCDFVRDVRQGGSPLACFATPSQRSLWDRLLRPIPRTTDNANVHIRPADGHWVAMTETNRHLRIDPDSLHNLGEQRYDDTLPARLYMSAHPQRDIETGELVNFGVVYGMRTRLMVFREPAGTRQRKVIGEIPLRRAPYVHSFALTRSSVVLVLPPFDVAPVALLGSDRPIADHFRWRPEAGTRIVVMNRVTGRCTSHHGPACFLFHTINAYDDEDGSIVLDLFAYDDADIIARQMRMDTIRATGMPGVYAHLHRIRLQAQQSAFHPLDLAPGRVMEFPAIHSARCAGRRHRHVWASDLRRPFKVDTLNGSVLAGETVDLVIGEPVFVPRPDARAEDDGVLLTVASSPAGSSSELICWDAATLDILCRASTPAAIPLGFHGSFVPSP